MFPASGNATLARIECLPRRHTSSARNARNPASCLTPHRRVATVHEDVESGNVCSTERADVARTRTSIAGDLHATLEWPTVRECNGVYSRLLFVGARLHATRFEQSPTWEIDGLIGQATV
jgi:hypothetical protein